MTLDNDSRKALWRAYPRLGVADRVFLASGPVGLVLLLVDWRIGLAVLLVGVPVLYWWKQRELERVMQSELAVMTHVRSAPPDPVVRNVTAEMAAARQVVVDVGQDWPDRDENDNPAIKTEVVYWDEDEGRWVGGRLRAWLSSGVMLVLPNFHIRVEGNDGALAFVGENASWLVDRLDLDYTQPAHELRSIPYDHEVGESVPRRLLFVMRGSGLDLMDRYLSEYGLVASFWIEREPRDWQRLAPPSPEEEV